MELKDYQITTLDAFARWLDELEKTRIKSESDVATLESVGVDIPADVRNYPKSAWLKLAESGGVAESAGAYVSRTDDAGRPIPHVCFKVPTGGGKTLLAAAALERLNRQTGLTLWITPTRAIYEQTKAALRNREHPYRQMLERASGGRVKFMEKDDALSQADIANYLCVMLISFQATNRERNKEFLRMFRDAGRYSTLFPDSDDALGDGRLLKDYPDLECTSENGPVKHSLLNAFKMQRPVVVLDEAHKAYGAKKRESNEEFVRTVNRLDPSLVIELSATPNRGISNLLVDITGVELEQEEMIKLPVQVTAFTNADWHHTLWEAHSELESLASEAESLQQNEGRYIRPIAVVRVERTGKDQRDRERVHSEDVREYLVQTLGVPAEAVAVKSAELDELRDVDLMSDLTQVRWIVTKAALMEGWDCSFAYLLVMLDNTQSQRALTQLVGRVMRQPDARRTNRAPLDQCYVYCLNTSVQKAVTQVKNGLENEGLTGLDGAVTGASSDFWVVSFNRREAFRNREIFLPIVLHREGTEWRELNYQRHMLPAIAWEEIDAPDTQDSMGSPTARQSAAVYISEARTVLHSDQDLYIDKTLSISWFARRIADVVPSPWQASRIAGQLVSKLRVNGYSDDDVHDRRSYLAFALREHVIAQVEKLAEAAFVARIGKDIRFDLETSRPRHRMVETYRLPVSGEVSLLARNDDRAIQFSLFEPVYAQHFDSTLERSFARYLDEQRALQWWHRVAIRQSDNYYLRGWKQDRIWPDFIAMAGEEYGKPHLLVFETKGEHLKDNPDTSYKHRVFETLEQSFNVGRLKVCDGPMKGTFRMVFNEAEFPAALAAVNGAYSV